MFTPRENNRLLDYYKIISISRPILARANMGLDFVSGQYGCLFSRCRKYVINRLIHGHFHIGLVIIPRPMLALDSVSGQYGGLGMKTRPIWKCPCINLYVLDDKEKFLLVKFRTSNHRLPIEVGRWRNIKRENRICNLCNGRNLGDEFHYLFECPSLSNERKKYFEPHFLNRPNILKFCNLMNSKSVSVLCNMCKYIRIINMRVCSPG